MNLKTQLTSIGAALSFTLASVACSSDEGKPPQRSTSLPASLTGSRATVLTHRAVGDLGDSQGFRDLTHQAQWEARIAHPDDLAQVAVSSHAPSKKTSTELSVEAASLKDESEAIVAVLDIDGPVPDNGPLKGAFGSASIASAVNDRAAALKPSQDAVLSQVVASGGRLVTRRWLANQIVVELPAGKLRELAMRADVSSVSLDGPVVLQQCATCDATITGLEGGTSGLAVRDGMRAWEETFFGYWGDSGGKTGGAVQLHVIDGGIPVRSHVALKDQSGVERILGAFECTTSGCALSSSAGSTGHGDAVTKIAASIGWTDPNCTSNLAHRSGLGIGTDIVFHDVDGCVAVGNALQVAAFLGADVVNLSLGLDPNFSCNELFDCGGVNSLVWQAVDSGITVVAAAGNESSPICSLSHPAIRSEVIAVGGLNTFNLTVNYDSATIWPSSATGGYLYDCAPSSVPTQCWQTSGIDLVAGAIHNYTGVDAPNCYANDASSIAAGTSFATPQISGAVSMIKDGLSDLGWPTNPKAIKAHLLLMGDNTTWNANYLGNSGVDRFIGLGRLHMYLPYSGWAPAPNTWEQGSVSIANGTSLSVCINGCAPMPADVTQLNWVLYYEDQDMLQVPQIHIKINELGTGQTIAQDVSGNMVKRIQLLNSDLSGKVLMKEIIGVAVTPGDPQTAFEAMYFHSDPVLH